MGIFMFIFPDFGGKFSYLNNYSEVLFNNRVWYPDTVKKTNHIINQAEKFSQDTRNLLAYKFDSLLVLNK